MIGQIINFPLSRYAFVEIFGLRFVQDICLAGPRDCKGQKKLPYIGEGVRALSHSHWQILSNEQFEIQISI